MRKKLSDEWLQAKLDMFASPADDRIHQMAQLAKKLETPAERSEQHALEKAKPNSEKAKRS